MKGVLKSRGEFDSAEEKAEAKIESIMDELGL